MGFKRAFLSLAAVAVLGAALFGGPALAAATPGSIDQLPFAEAPLLAPVASDASGLERNACVFAIVEDFATCRMAVVVMSGVCPAVVPRLLNALGTGVVGTSLFQSACPPEPVTRPPD